MTGTEFSVRQAAYDIKKLRAKLLVIKPAHRRRYHVPPEAARTMSALAVLRDHVIAPILAGVRSPRQGLRPTAWTQVDRDYEALRIDMQKLFRHLNISTAA
jgi:hypothetical protein